MSTASQDPGPQAQKQALNMRSIKPGFWLSFRSAIGKTLGTLLMVTIFGLILLLIVSTLGEVPTVNVQRWVKYEYTDGKLKLVEFPSTADDNVLAIVKLRGLVETYCNGANICPEHVEAIATRLLADKAKGVILVVNSPGGELGASERLYQVVKELTEQMPVWVFIEDLAASGAYYFIAPANKIVASDVSLVGSIGVYLEVINYDGLLNKLGIKRKVLVSKESKYKNMEQWLFNNTDNDEVDRMVQESLDYSWQVFVKRVTSARKNVKNTAFTGGVWHAPKALELGLVDKTSSSFEGTIVEFLTENYPDSKKQWVIYEYSASYGFMAPFGFVNSFVDNLKAWNQSINRALSGEEIRLLLK